MDNETQRSKPLGNKIPVYVRDKELWVLYPKDSTGKEFATSRLNDVFWSIDVIAKRGAPEFCLVDDDIQIIYEDGRAEIIQYLGDYIVPMDEE